MNPYPYYVHLINLNMKSHKFIIFDGNYPDTIRAVLRQKKNYMEVPCKLANYDELSFIWKPCPYTQQVTFLASNSSR